MPFVFPTVIFTCIGICINQNGLTFSIQDNELSATEGSCAEIKCNTVAGSSTRTAKWFWMKDPVWDPEKRNFFNISYVYSTDEQDVSADFRDRVKFTGTGPPWYNGRTCSIQICNLKKTDSGNYQFRFLGSGNYKYSAGDTKLTVTGKYDHPISKDLWII